MFFEEDLQSGIALALSESKCVACFIKGGSLLTPFEFGYRLSGEGDDDVQSSLWEDDFLKDEQITTALTAKAITLRINGGTQEAQYLAAYYPIPVLPAFIMIDDAHLVLDLRAPERKDHFKAAILKALSSSRWPQSPTLNSDPSIIQQTSNQTVPQTSTLAASSSSVNHFLEQPDTSTTPPSPGSAASLNSETDTLSSTARNTADHPNVASSRSHNVDPTVAIASNATRSLVLSSSSLGGQPSQIVQNLLAERRRRLDVDKNEKDTAEKAERRAKAETRKEAMDVAPGSAKAKQATYAAQQRKRQQEAKLERERVLRQIDHDKAERKEKEERRKVVAKAEAEATDGAGGLVDRQLASEVNFPKSTGSRDCAVQIRLYDGSTIRSRFHSDQTLRGNVRPWIDQQKSDDVPYTFKQILMPMPNRTLSISDEEETFQSLGFVPSATLVIVPVQDYTAAYSGGQGIVLKGSSAAYNAVSAGARSVSGALGTFLGLGRATAPGEIPDTLDTAMQGDVEADSTGTGSGINIRTLRDQRDNQDNHQLYNGNQVLFPMCPTGCPLELALILLVEL